MNMLRETRSYWKMLIYIARKLDMTVKDAELSWNAVGDSFAL